MALVNQPPILASSFAVNGDKNTIPTTNSGTEGLASLSLGFPPITQQPVSQGGIPPQRADFNGIFNLITNFLMFLQNGSIFAYSSTLDYQPPAIVYGNNALYRCIATNGANTSAGVQPLSNTSYWQPLIPVGGITVSGNTITVTNETGTQIQYTIDTITNPPSQSDSSNKIVTSAWVKAYAPSKTGTGANGTWGINITGNAGTATKSTQDSQGQQINTTYVKGVTASNATLTVTKGNGTTSSITVNNVSRAEYSDRVGAEAGYSNDTKGSGLKGGLSQSVIYNNGFPFAYGNLISVKNSGANQIALEWSNATGAVGRVAVRSARDVGIDTWSAWRYLAYTESPAFSGTPTAPTPATTENSTRVATTAFVNNYAPSKNGNGANGIWGINITGNAGTATKATQDSAGQTINTTYVKGITASNATLTVTKGNGTISTVTINNVGNSTKATQDSAGQTINTTYVKGVTASNSTITVTKGNGTTSTATINNVANATNAANLVIRGTSASIKYGGGDVDESTAISQNKVNLVIGSWYSTGFRDLSSSGTPIKVAINHRNGNIKTSGAVTAVGAMYSATPATTENSTRVATTAYARSLLQRAVGKTQPTLTGLIDWEAMKSANGGTDVRNIKNTSSGITAYGGDVEALNKGDIILKRAFTNFDALLIRYTHDDGWCNRTVIIPIWEFNIMFNTKGFFQLLKEGEPHWQIRGNGYSNRPSTTTRLNVREQNCGIIEIYGITY